MRAILILVCSLGTVWSTENGEVESGALAAGDAAIDAVVQATAEPVQDVLRDKRRSSLAPVSSRWYSMLREVTGDSSVAEGWGSIPPFWLPMGLSSAGTARSNDGGSNTPVLVLPVPVPASVPEVEENLYVAPKRISGKLQVATGKRRSGGRGRGTGGEVDMELPLLSKLSAGENKLVSPSGPQNHVKDLLLTTVEPIESSEDLVKQYREQIDDIPDEYEDNWVLEPLVVTEKPQVQIEETDKSSRVVVRRRRVRRALKRPTKGPAADIAVVAADGEPLPVPPRPSFEGPIALNGWLYIRTAQFWEPFSLWRDASGLTRTEMHGGATVGVRVPQPDGQLQLQLMQVDRSGASEVRRCANTEPFPANPAFLRLPVLPDVNLLSFAGYARNGAQRVEVWRGVEEGALGAAGASPGEALRETHELLVLRTSNGTLPVQYRVTVDSSVLGLRSDGHVLRFDPPERALPEVWVLDAAQCDTTEVLRPDDDDDLARLEPLREFAARGRNPRYTNLTDKYKIDNSRQYLDPREEAVRKTLLVQDFRFIESGNRAGRTFALVSNFLGDRLAVEYEVLQGVRRDISLDGPDPFPYSREELDCLGPQLSPAFDWREHGGVTPVRSQGLNCSSCWAFAVTGAMEGAVFIKEKELHQLSEQTLVDCAQPFGGRGCGGTWPEHAYEYVAARGLPEADNYRPYSGTVRQCGAEGRALPATRITGFTNVPPENIDAIKVAIRLHAPVVVVMNIKSNNFKNFKTGVLADIECMTTRENQKHAMVAVGWDNQNGRTNLIVKNSWSDMWGENGYIRVQADGNTCGVLSLPSLPLLQGKDRYRDFASCQRED